MRRFKPSERRGIRRKEIAKHVVIVAIVIATSRRLETWIAANVGSG